MLLRRILTCESGDGWWWCSVCACLMCSRTCLECSDLPNGLARTTVPSALFHVVPRGRDPLEPPCSDGSPIM
jgi:hypothetical protein